MLSTMPVLELKQVVKKYGAVVAVEGASFSVSPGEIVGLLGPNGAGKTTTLRAISGLIIPREGNIRYDGEDLSKYKAHEIVYKGISMVPEGRGVFSRLSVTENLEMGAYSLNTKQELGERIHQFKELTAFESAI